MASLAATGILGIFYFGTAARVYQGQAQILVRHSQPDGASINVMSDRNTQDQMATFERLFTSAVVLERALGILDTLPPEVPSTSSREEALEALRDMLDAQALRRTSIIEVTCRSEEPDAAVQVVNAVVTSYLAYMDETHKSVSAQVVGSLRQELREREQQLSEREKQLVLAKQSCADLGLDSDSGFVHPAIQSVIRLNEASLDLQQRRVQLNASLSAIKNSVAAGSDLRQHLLSLEPLLGRDILLSAIGLNAHDTTVLSELEQQGVENQGKLNALLEHYQENHPRVQQLRAQIESASAYVSSFQAKLQQRVAGMQSQELGTMLVNLVQEDLNRTIAQEQQMQQQYAMAQAEAKELITQRSTITILERDLESLRELKANLISRIGTLEINQSQTDVSVSIVSHPIRPDHPISPLLPNVALMSLFAGAVIGAACIYVVDVIDDRFRSPEELQEQLGVQVLAMIRKHEIVDGVGIESLLVHHSPDAAESEAFRTLRTTLAFTGQETNRLVISSSEPSDGKTTVMANLGVSYAQSGKRTLLIDCDLRRPGMTNMFQLRKYAGVAEILRSHDDLSTIARECLVSSGLEGLDVLPSGRRPPDPAEILSRDRFAELIAWAETEYDQILIDTPPVLAAADAAIIGRLLDGIIIVVQPQKNHRRRVLRAFEGVAQMGLNVLGVVINAVDEQDGTSYYGYGGYGYGYGYGYGADEEEFDDSDDAVPQTVTHAGHRGSQSVSGSAASSHPDSGRDELPKRRDIDQETLVQVRRRAA